MLVRLYLGEKLKPPDLKFWLIFEVNEVNDACEPGRFRGNGVLLQGSVNEGIDCFFMIMKLFELQLNMKIFMGAFLFLEALVFDLVLTVSGNAEGG